MAINAYIADLDGSNEVYLNINPSPIPFLKYRGSGAEKRTLNGRAGGIITPGQWHHYVSGTHITGGTIDVACQQMTRATYVSLISKLTGSGMGRVQFSPDEGTTIYSCVMHADDMQLDPIDGTELLEGKIVLKVTGVDITEPEE